ncbi:MAG TPA: glycosyltransferase, partial [Candidatus Sulfotelmatobacter sp.]|nr:glycosyltransferase [Candidatus Sulfotelmatobacter sp.]
FLNVEKTAAAAGLKTQAVLSLIDFARRRGTKIVWTVHNLGSHERRYPGIEKWFWRAFLQRLDGFITLSESGLQSARERFPELRSLPGSVVPHGHYRGEYPDDKRTDCRQRLGIPTNAKVVLFFGWIREYKNVPGLIAAFRGLNNPDAALCLAGREFPKSGASKSGGSVREQAGSDARIHMHLRHVPNEEVQTFFRAADLVVLPYREILNSGTALLALSFNRPVLVPNKGAMAELQALVGRNWVRTYEGDLTTEQLAEALQWAQHEHRAAIAPLESLDWNRVGEQTLAAYRNVLFPPSARDENIVEPKQESRSASASALHS